MNKNIISVVTGLMLAVITFMIFEAIGAKIFPLPADVDIHNQEQLNAYTKNAPFKLMLPVLAGWICGSTICGFVIEKISRGTKSSAHALRLPIIAGTILTVAGVLNLFAFQHPIWVIVVTFVVYIPFVLLGFRFSKGQPVN